MTDKAEEMINGAYDFHVHTAPDVMKRSVNDIELAKLAKKYGMGGFLIKSHHSTSYGRASLVREVVEGIKVFGGISLNNPLGGINPQAVDTAGRMGAKIIWMPTVDSDNEAGKFLDENNPKLPFWATIQRELYKKGILRPPIKVRNEDGKIKREIYEIIDLVKEYDMILATGHLKPSDGLEIVKLALSRGLSKIVVTHPDFPTTLYTIEQQKSIAKPGVYFEHCYTTPATNKVEWVEVLKQINETGAERNILSTDLGQPNALLPPVGLMKFIERFIEMELSEDKIVKMIKDNQEKMLFN
jgi:predicted TIM-barrel fold metal-dependent hydrolase